MKKIALILALIMLVSVFVGCKDEKPVETKPKKTQTTTPVEEEPEIEYAELYFDDRKGVYEVFGTIVNEFEIISQNVTSKVVGSDELDEAVVEYDEASGRIIAVGTGTAVVKVNGEEYNIRVSAAPITLAVITGHSLGAGAKGNLTDSVVCEAGQAYNTTLSIGSEKEANPDWADGMKGNTLGYAEENRVTNIDCITSDAGSTKGARGINSGLAYQWNKLTGEKIWVVNCAVGGSCINQWQPGATKKYHENSLAAINLASEILKGEVEAGHYDYKTTVMINFASANFTTPSQAVPAYDDALLEKWHDDMWNGYVNGVTVDIDGDGVIDAPAHLGYVPFWTPSVKKFNRTDIPLVYYRAASAEYPNVFLANEYTRHWLTDEEVKATFPTIQYNTQSNKALNMPTTVKQVFDSDNTHLLQVGYNAVGMDVAVNLYNYLNGKNNAESITLYEMTNDVMGVEVGDALTLKANTTYKLAIVSNPVGVNDFTIELSSNLTMSGFFYVTATQKGEGTITIKSGDEIIKQVTVTIE